MATTILDAAMAESIRTLLGVGATVLPDTVLMGDLLGGEAERAVLDRVGDPAYADRPADEQAMIRHAIAYTTAAAALGTGAVREVLTATSERFSDQYTVQRTAPDLDRWAGQLRRKAARALSGLVPDLGVGALFLLAPGRRGA